MKKQEDKKIIVVQRIIPSYRIDFFRLLDKSLKEDFQVWYSSNPEKNKIFKTKKTSIKFFRNLGHCYSFLGSFWQFGVIFIPIKRNDIIILEGNPRIITNFFLILRCYFKRANFVWWGHLYSSTSKNLRSKIRLKIMSFFSNILFYTDEEAKKYKKFKEVKNNIFYLNNGVDLEKLNPLRKSYDSSKREIDIFFIGRFTKKSNINLLLKALINDNCKNYTAILIGAESDEEVIEYENILKLHYLTDRVTIKKVITDERDIAYFANRTKIFCYPGSVGLSLIHSMAYGLPSLIHDESKYHMPEFSAFKENFTGINFKYLDHNSLSKSISKILEDENILKNFSQNSIQIVESKYNFIFMKNKFLEMIKQISQG